MRWSRYFIPTLREDPAEAEIVSHKFLLRGGYIRQVARGIYDYLPLGLRVIRKIESIVREELNAVGCHEVLLPVVIPAELWQESGRWPVDGKELLRLRDRNDREFCIGPTHEELITDIVRRDIRSYRDLPRNFYQIHTKFRDEIRPRFGLMRGREFIMKDGYSFHPSYKDLDDHYEVMRRAYIQIFARCGLATRVVEADSGPIGGTSSHEVVVLAETGEDAIVSCEQCEYAANMEKAETKIQRTEDRGQKTEKPKKLEKIHTPGMKSIEEVSKFLKSEPSQMIKTLIYLRDDGLVVALISGDREINEVKLKNAAKAQFVVLADEKTIRQLTNANVGFAGPVGLPKEVKGIGKVTVIADRGVEPIVNGNTGANETDYHLTGVCPGRDFHPEAYVDLAIVRENDSCPCCKNGKLKIQRGIEVGHIFKLGTKYSAAMKAHFLDEGGKEQPIIMGTYGIGIGRTAQAAIEQNYKEKGMVWPLPIAPFSVELISLSAEEEVRKTADQIYKELMDQKVDVLFDDREERAGVKFADGDLVGAPFQVLVGAKGLKEGKVELKNRKTGVVEKLSLRAVGEAISGLLCTPPSTPCGGLQTPSLEGRVR